jgi:hypothetical protein
MPLVAEGSFTNLDRGDVREVIDEARVRAEGVLDRADVPARRVMGERVGLPPLV